MEREIFATHALTTTDDSDGDGICDSADMCHGGDDSVDEMAMGLPINVRRVTL